MAAMTYFSDRVVSANKLIIAAAVLYAGALTFAHAASLPAYDPYGAQARIAEEQADAADPQIDAIKDQSLKMYWKCVGDFADAVHRNYGRPTDLEAAQKSVGPQCNRMAMGNLKNQVFLYKTRRAAAQREALRTDADRAADARAAAVQKAENDAYDAEAIRRAEAGGPAVPCTFTPGRLCSYPH